MRLRIITAAFLCGFALSGCMDSQPPQSVAENSVNVGETPAPVAVASVLFTKVCVETLPSFANAQKHLKAPEFEQNPSTGIYYHQKYDLSFKLQRSKKQIACSMVFASTDDPLQLAMATTLPAASYAVGAAEVQIDPATNASTVQLDKSTIMIFEPLTIGRARMYRAFIVTKN